MAQSHTTREPGKLQQGSDAWGCQLPWVLHAGPAQEFPGLQVTRIFTACCPGLSSCMEGP